MKTFRKIASLAYSRQFCLLFEMKIVFSFALFGLLAISNGALKCYVDDPPKTKKPCFDDANKCIMIKSKTGRCLEPDEGLSVAFHPHSPNKIWYVAVTILYHFNLGHLHFSVSFFFTFIK